jgi:hypothetical protein
MVGEGMDEAIASVQTLRDNSNSLFFEEKKNSNELLNF